MQSAKIGAGFHADLFHEKAPCIAKRLERLGLAPTAIQREHALRVQALAQGVLGQQALDLAEDLLMAPRAQVSVDGQLGGRLAQLLEPADLGGGERLIGQVGQRGSSEEAQRLARRVGWLARRRRASRFGHEPLEAGDVHQLRINAQLVAAPTRADLCPAVGVQRLAQTPDVVLDHLGRARRWLLPPQPLDQAIRRHRTIGLEPEHRQDGALLGAAERDRMVVDAGLKVA